MPAPGAGEVAKHKTIQSGVVEQVVRPDIPVDDFILIQLGTAFDQLVEDF